MRALAGAECAVVGAGDTDGGAARPICVILDSTSLLPTAGSCQGPARRVGGFVLFLLPWRAQAPAHAVFSCRRRRSWNEVEARGPLPFQTTHACTSANPSLARLGRDPRQPKWQRQLPSTSDRFQLREDGTLRVCVSSFLSVFVVLVRDPNCEQHVAAFSKHSPINVRAQHRESNINSMLKRSVSN